MLVINVKLYAFDERYLIQPGTIVYGGKIYQCNSLPAEWVRIAKEEARGYCAGVMSAPNPAQLQNPIYQLTKCPRGSWPNDKLDDCVCAYGGTMKNGKCEGMKLSKKDLYYGPQGAAAPLHKQCWTKTSDDAYKVCMGFDN